MSTARGSIAVSCTGLPPNETMERTGREAQALARRLQATCLDKPGFPREDLP